MRVLVITHSRNTVYGAAKSLKNLLHNCDWEFDFIYPDSLFNPVDKYIMERYTNYKAKKYIDCFYLLKGIRYIRSALFWKELKIYL